MRQDIEQANQFVTDADGRLAVLHGEPAAVTGQVGASIGDTLVAPVYGMSSISVVPLATGPILAYEVSFDGGTNWTGTQLWVAATLTLTASSFTALGVNGHGEMPPGATHFRVRATSAPGAITVRLQASAMTYRANQPVLLLQGSTVALGNSTVRIGAVGAMAQGTWNVESTTPLGAAGTLTGVTRDLALTGPTNFIASTASAFKEFRMLAAADVTGTLHLEVSPDLATWSRVRSIATAALGSLFLADLSYAPVVRYARLVYVNGAGAQATFLAATAGLAD